MDADQRQPGALKGSCTGPRVRRVPDADIPVRPGWWGPLPECWRCRPAGHPLQSHLHLHLHLHPELRANRRKPIVHVCSLLHMPCHAMLTMGACDSPTALLSPLSSFPAVTPDSAPRSGIFGFLLCPPWSFHAFYSRFPAAPSHPPLAHLHRGYLRYNNYRPHPPALLVDHLPAIPTVSACVSTSLALDCLYTASRLPTTIHHLVALTVPILAQARVAVRQSPSTTTKPRSEPQTAYSKRRRSCHSRVLRHARAPVCLPACLLRRQITHAVDTTHIDSSL